MMATINEHRIKLIQEKLTQALNPTKLKITDESHHHIGHAGAETGMGHFSVEIESPNFNGKSTLESHQLVYAALGNLMKTDIHALTISAKTPA